MFFHQLVLLLLALVSVPWMLLPSLFFWRSNTRKYTPFLFFWLKLFVFMMLIFSNNLQFFIYQLYLICYKRLIYLFIYVLVIARWVFFLSFSFSLSLFYLFLRGTKLDPTHCFTVVMTNLLNWSHIRIPLDMWSLSLVKFLYINLSIP